MSSATLPNVPSAVNPSLLSPIDGTPRSIPFLPTEDELARLLPSSVNGPVTFHGWAPVRQPVLIVRHLASNRMLYIGLDGKEYRFQPFAEYGGQLSLQGGAHGKFRR